MSFSPLPPLPPADMHDGDADGRDLATLEHRIKAALGAVQAARSKSTSPFDVRSQVTDATPEDDALRPVCVCELDVGNDRVATCVCPRAEAASRAPAAHILMRFH